jgi:hypothetical protein
MPGPEKRKNRRYLSVGRARIPKAFSGDAFLKDLGIAGCCVECTMSPDVERNAVYKIVICPEADSKIGYFELSAECRWIRQGGDFCGIGFAVIESPRGKAFQRYVDYLSWRSST